MTAVTASLKIRVSIGGQSWSQCYDSFSAGVPQRSPSGLLPITGKLSLAPSRPPESMDPRVNRDRFRRGNSVNIDVFEGGAWVRHKFGTLFILKTPSLYQPDANLELEVGCKLVLRNVAAPSDDKSGVTIGANSSRSAIINNLLAAANAPALVTTIDAYPINYPIPKIEGSYIEQAGKVAYSALKYLWQNNAGQIVALDGAINPAATPVYKVRIGYNEAEYSGSGGEEIPCELYRTAGTGTQLKANYETQSDYSEDYGPVSAIDPAFTGNTVVRTITTTTIVDSNGNRNTEIVQETGSATYSITAPKQFTLVWRSTTNSRQIFSGDRLAREEKLTLSPLEAIAPAYIEGLPAGLQFSVGHSEALERDITEYFYDGTGKVRKITQTVYKPAGAVVLGQATWDSDQALVEVTASQYTQEWLKVGAGYRKRETRAEAQVSEKVDGATTTVTIALVTTNTRTTTVSGDQNQPPATQNRPGTHTQVEVPLKGEAKFQIAPSGDESERTRPTQLVDYAVSNAQLNAIAQMEGAILIGRSQAHLIQAPYASAQPLDAWSIREVGGNTALYQIDGLEYNHERERAIVGGEGIWLSTISAGGALIVPYVPTVALDFAVADTCPITVIPVTATTPELITADFAVADTCPITVSRTIPLAFAVADTCPVAVSTVSTISLAFAVADTCPVAVSASPYLAETLGWLSRVQAAGSDVSTTAMDAMDAFLRGLATDSIDGKLDLVHLYGGITTFDGLMIPVRHPSNTAATNTDFVSGDYTASGSGIGLQGSGGGSKFIDHNYNIGSNHPGYSFFMGSYIKGLSTSTDNSAVMGASGGSDRQCHIYHRFSDTSCYVTSFRDVGGGSTGAERIIINSSGTADALVLQSRVSATDFRYFVAGSQIAATTDTNSNDSTGLGSLLSFQAGSGATAFRSSRKHVLALAGDGLTASEVSALNSRVSTLITALSV